jgi:transcriptional regulator with XRE-family HTH domain
MHAQDTTKTIVGSKIRRARMRLGITQLNLSFRVGLARASVVNIEAGRVDISVTRLLSFASALHVRPWRLLP